MWISHRKEIRKLKFRAFRRSDSSVWALTLRIRSDEGLTLEMSAFESLYGGQPIHKLPYFSFSLRVGSSGVQLYCLKGLLPFFFPLFFSSTFLLIFPYIYYLPLLTVNITFYMFSFHRYVIVYFFTYWYNNGWLRTLIIRRLFLKLS